MATTTKKLHTEVYYKVNAKQFPGVKVSHCICNPEDHNWHQSPCTGSCNTSWSSNSFLVYCSSRQSLHTRHSTLDTDEQLEMVQGVPGILLTMSHHPSLQNICTGRNLKSNWFETLKQQHRWHLHKSYIIDCAVTPPVTIPVPRRAPVYNDSCISSITREWLNHRSLGTRSNNVGTAASVTMIARVGSRCCTCTGQSLEVSVNHV